MRHSKLSGKDPISTAPVELPMSSQPHTDFEREVEQLIQPLIQYIEDYRAFFSSTDVDDQLISALQSVYDTLTNVSQLIEDYNVLFAAWSTGTASKRGTIEKLCSAVETRGLVPSQSLRAVLTTAYEQYCQWCDWLSEWPVAQEVTRASVTGFLIDAYGSASALKPDEGTDNPVVNFLVYDFDHSFSNQHQWRARIEAALLEYSSDQRYWCFSGKKPSLTHALIKQLPALNALPSSFYEMLFKRLLEHVKTSTSLPAVIDCLEALLSYQAVSHRLANLEAVRKVSPFSELMRTLYQQVSQDPLLSTSPKWKRLLHTLINDPLLWRFAALDRAVIWLERARLLQSVYQDLVKPLHDYAMRTQKDWDRCLLGGPPARRLKEAADQLYQREFLGVYRWSGTLLLLLSETDPKRYEARYQQLLLAWLQEGGSSSLGKAFRSTPRLSGRDVVSDEVRVSRVFAYWKQNQKSYALPVRMNKYTRSVMAGSQYLPAEVEQLVVTLGACIVALEAEKKLPIAREQQQEITELLEQFPLVLDELEDTKPKDFKLRVSALHAQLYLLWERTEVLSSQLAEKVQAARTAFHALERSHADLKVTLLRLMEGVMVASRSVSSGAISTKPSELKRLFGVFETALFLVGSTNKFLAGPLLLASIETGEQVLQSLQMVEVNGLPRGAHSELFGTMKLCDRMQRWYEKKSGHYSEATQLQHINNSLPAFEDGARWAKQLVHQLLQVYADPMERLTPESCVVFGVYLIGLIFVYLKHGLLSEAGRKSDAVFVQELLSWLALADYTLLHTGIGRLSEVKLERLIGGSVTAAALLSRAGVLCADKNGRVFRFWYGDQSPGAYGYRLALASEVAALNESIKARNWSGHLNEQGYVFWYGDDLSRYAGEFEVMTQPWQPESALQEQSIQSLEAKEALHLQKIRTLEETVEDQKKQIKVSQASHLQKIKSLEERINELEKTIKNQPAEIDLKLKEQKKNLKKKLSSELKEKDQALKNLNQKIDSLEHAMSSLMLQLGSQNAVDVPRPHSGNVRSVSATPNIGIFPTPLQPRDSDGSDEEVLRHLPT